MSILHSAQNNKQTKNNDFNWEEEVVVAVDGGALLCSSWRQKKLCHFWTINWIQIILFLFRFFDNFEWRSKKWFLMHLLRKNSIFSSNFQKYNSNFFFHFSFSLFVKLRLASPFPGNSKSPKSCIRARHSVWPAQLFGRRNLFFILLYKRHSLLTI